MLMKVYKRYEGASFDNFDGESELVKILRKPYEIKDNIILTGGVGTGKTYLAYCILNQEAEKVSYPKGLYYRSENIIYSTIKEIIESIRKCWEKESDEFDREKVEKYKTAQLLIIDEIGVQYGSDSERIELFEIFNERYNNMLPTIAISNYSRKDIEKTLGLRITDRLFGGAKIIELKGKSRR